MKNNKVQERDGVVTRKLETNVKPVVKPRKQKRRKATTGVPLEVVENKS